MIASLKTLIISRFRNFRNDFKQKLSKDKGLKDLLISIPIFLLVVLVVWLFTKLLYDFLIDGYLIDNSTFLTNFTVKMEFYSRIGYFVACICFTSYLLLAQKVNQLNDEKDGVLNSDADKRKFFLLKAAFRNAFALSALILSMFVIWLGVMFNAINSLELMEYYGQASGKQFLNNDFIYLVGIMHSLLLLIFYVPVQIAFNSISIVEEQNAEAKDLTGFKKSFVGFFESFSSVLITASPLLTSLVQGGIQNFLKDA